MRQFLMTTALALALPLTAAAEDAALLLGNGDYDAFGFVRGGDTLADAAPALGNAGLRVTARADASAVETADALRRFLATVESGADRVAVILSGRFVHSGQDGYLLPVDATAPASLVAAARDGVPLSVILAILADRPGNAILVLGAAPGASGGAGAFLNAGPGPIVPPQGVTILRGTPTAAAEFARRTLPEPQARIVAEARNRYRMSVAGYAPDSLVFLTEAPKPDADETAPETPEPDPQPEPQGPTAAELWDDAQQADTIPAYERYLDAFPEGPNADAARATIEEIRTEPDREARKAEEALDLSRDARREIQRDLSILDYDTRGIDGIFGPGSRNAIGKWQAANDLEATSYVTANQITRLDGQAERRAAEIEEEAKKRREEQERQDRAFWEETGAKGDEAGLRAYLKKYPDGVFAEVAQDRLAAIDAERKAQAAGEERRAWTFAQDSDSADAYRGYLRNYPEGAFAAEAQARLDELSRSDSERNAEKEAEARETALGLNGVTRRLVESRLAGLGLKPGEVDGTFDGATRRALRRYQDARELRVTGYLDQDTVVRLLADAILQ